MQYYVCTVSYSIDYIGIYVIGNNLNQYTNSINKVSYKIYV